MKVKSILAVLLLVCMLATLVPTQVEAQGENKRFIEKVDFLMDYGNTVSERVAIYDVWKRFEKGKGDSCIPQSWGTFITGGHPYSVKTT